MVPSLQTVTQQLSDMGHCQHTRGDLCLQWAVGGPGVMYTSLTQKSMLKKKSKYFTTGLTNEKSSPMTLAAVDLLAMAGPVRSAPMECDRCVVHNPRGRVCADRCLAEHSDR